MPPKFAEGATDDSRARSTIRNLPRSDDLSQGLRSLAQWLLRSYLKRREARPPSRLDSVPDSEAPLCPMNDEDET